MDPQIIYNEYMTRSVLFLSTLFPNFNIDKLSEHMQKNYNMMQTQLEQPVESGYYKIRNSGNSTTYLQLNKYPNLFYIFSQLLVNQDHLKELARDFKTECKKATCDAKEAELSKKEHPEMSQSIKDMMTKNLPGSVRCIDCFKYSPMTASIQLVQNIFKKYQTIPLDLFSINTCIGKTCINTSKISYSSLKSNGYTYNMMMLTHTPIENIGTLLDHLTIVWDKPTQKTEQECYVIHWLFCIAMPFLRGSAGCAKVLLNAMLFKNGFKPVKERDDFYQQTDWVAMFSPTFDIYWTKKDEMFEDDTEFQGRVDQLPKMPVVQQGEHPKIEAGDAFKPKAKKSKKSSKKRSKKRSKKSSKKSSKFFTS